MKMFLDLLAAVGIAGLFGLSLPVDSILARVLMGVFSAMILFSIFFGWNQT